MSDKVEVHFQGHLIRHKDGPFCWWKVNGDHFPHLSKKFPEIPATSTPLQMVFSVADIVVKRKRYVLILDMADDKVFLHRNSYFLGPAEKEPSIPQAELLLLPKDQEMIEISDDKETMDRDVVAIADDVDSIDEWSDVNDDVIMMMTEMFQINNEHGFL